MNNISELPKGLANDGWLGDVSTITTLRDWNIKFGQIPECRSYAEGMRSRVYTFSECGSSNTVIRLVRGFPITTLWEYRLDLCECGTLITLVHVAETAHWIYRK